MRNTRGWRMPALLLLAWSSGAHALQSDLLAQLVQQKRYADAVRAIDARLARDASDPIALAASVDLHLARGRPDGVPLARETAER